MSTYFSISFSDSDSDSSNDKVDRYVSKRIYKCLHENRGSLIYPYIRSELSTQIGFELNNQSYFKDAIKQQTENFNNIHESHKQKLNETSHALIESKIREITLNTDMSRKMEQHIYSKLERESKEYIEKKAAALFINGVVFGSAFGATICHLFWSNKFK